MKDGDTGNLISWYEIVIVSFKSLSFCVTLYYISLSTWFLAVEHSFTKLKDGVLDFNEISTTSSVIFFATPLQDLTFNNMFIFIMHFTLLGYLKCFNFAK